MEEDKSPNGTFTQVPNMFLETCDLPETAQILFLRLLRHYGHTGGAFTGSTRKLANLVHMSKSTIDRMSKRLRDANLIKIEYQLSKETEQEIMTITLNTTELWDTNRHHCKIEPVPNWDSTLPKRDSVTQPGTAQTNLGQDVPDVSEDSTQEDSKKILNTDKTVKTVPPHLQAFHLLYSKSRFFRGSKKMNTDKLGYYEELAPEIITLEQLESLYKLAEKRNYGNDKNIYLGNLVSALPEWEEQSQQTPEGQEDDYWYPGMEIPGNLERDIARACKQKWGESLTHAQVNDTFKRTEVPPMGFKALFEKMFADASSAENVLIRIRQQVTTGRV